ncbi:MAG TPA: cytochrome C oxidase subunit IV family protein [Sphingomonas sp.]|nr:cytochrome C oxidase subunit IV family protein [Sphingomonas sp.]
MRKEMRHIVLAPVITWVALLALLFTSLGYAYWHAGPEKLVVGLGIAAIKASLIGLIFMELRKSSGLVRMAAAAGLTWLSFLFLLSFADFLTR